MKSDAGEAVKGAVFESGEGVFAVGLAGKDAPVGEGVCAGAADRAAEEAGESEAGVELGALLVVDVEDVKLAGARGEGAGPRGGETAQDRRAEGIEEEGDAGAGREGEGEGVAAENFRRRETAPGCAPVGKIAACDASESGVELDAENSAERELRGEEHGAAHPGAKIDEGVRVDGREGMAATPANDHGLEDGGSDGVVGGRMAIVAMAGAKMAAGDEAAGAHAVLEVEGMAEKALGDAEAGEKTRAG